MFLLQDKVLSNVIALGTSYKTEVPPHINRPHAALCQVVHMFAWAFLVVPLRSVMPSGAQWQHNAPWQFSDVEHINSLRMAYHAILLFIQI
mgnify:CR=1